jgi:hypothetical protein
VAVDLREDQDGLWRDYPVNGVFGNIRAGLSGIVVFALHYCFPPNEQLSDLDKRYVARLRIEELPAGYSELSGALIPSRGIDHVRVFVRPSQLAAADGSCSTLQRARALRWIRKTAPQLDDSKALAPTQPWAAAEFVIALNEVLSKWSGCSDAASFAFVVAAPPRPANRCDRWRKPRRSRA